jgi:RNA polymerase sigma factor (TIGR02999 family)
VTGIIRPDILSAMSEISRILDAIQAGDSQAANQLLPLVYDELRQLAAQKMAGENPGHTLDATALVHEAWIRLAGTREFANKGHFLRAAAEAMRRILIDHARCKRADKRGGDRKRAAVEPDHLLADAGDPKVIAVDEAIRRFAVIDAQAAELVTLRYFGGLSMAEAAESLDISSRTADRLWAYAKAWLYRELSGTFLA